MKRSLNRNVSRNGQPSASPAKLRDGSWGAKVAGKVKAGDQITITTKAGKSWKAKVEKVVWSGDGVSLVATQSKSQSRRGYEVGDRIVGWDGVVGSPSYYSSGAFDEYDY